MFAISKNDSKKIGLDALIEIFPEDLSLELGYNDLGGLEKQLKIIQEFEEFSKMTIGSKSANAIHGRLLFLGPPGTGKTVTARAFAKSLGWLYYELDISTIVSAYLGETPKSIAAIFKYVANRAKNNSKKRKSGVVFFLDEFDSIGSSRSSSRDHQEIARAVNALLIELERTVFGKTGLFVICATNLESQLDPALRRRFDCVINFPMPDFNARLDILNESFRKNNFAQIDARVISEQTEGYSPSDLTRLVNRGVFLRILKPKEAITTQKYLNMIDEGIIEPSNLINNHKSKNPQISFNDPQKDTFHLEDPDFSNSYLELLIHAINRNPTRGKRIVSALKAIENIPYEIRVELYYYSHGRILGEKYPAKLVEQLSRKM